MSGKLIMKRKLDKKQQAHLQTLQQDINGNNELSSTTNSAAIQFLQNNHDDSSNDESRVSCSSAPLSKRLRCDTPPPEAENDDADADDADVLPSPPLLHDQVNHDNFINNQRNRHLLEAIQSKVLELQQELDEFEQDFGVNEEDYYNRVTAPAPQAEISEHEAEALGYAMCAQETMLFLQREGIPANSLIYTRLRDALVGQEQTLRF